MLVAEVDHGQGGVVGHVTGTRAEGRLGIFGFEWGDFTGLAVVAVLQKGEVSFYVGNIDVLSVGWKEDAVGFSLALVHCGNGLAGDAVIVEGVDVESSVSVTDSKDVPIFLIKAQVAGAVIKIDILMFLVGTIFV